MLFNRTLCRGKHCRLHVVLLSVVVLVGQIGTSVAATEVLPIADFSTPNLDSWKHREFNGETHYEVVKLDNKSVLKAVTTSTASVLFKILDIDLTKTPYLNWSWRVENIYSIKNQKNKSGDDYPARVYVIIREGFFPWQTKALSYVWSNRVVKEAFWSNPFTDNAVMIPLRSGTEGVGQWHTERVNIKEDFYRVFKKHITKAHGVAIMSDSDNSYGTGVAYYGPISFSD